MNDEKDWTGLIGLAISTSIGLIIWALFIWAVIKWGSAFEWFEWL